MMGNVAGALPLLLLTVARVTDAFFGLGGDDSSPSIEIRPQDPYLEVGSTLTLTCAITSPAEENNSASMYFEFVPHDRGTAVRLSESIVDDRTIQLTIENVTKDHSGYYYCYQDQNGSPALWMDTSDVVVLDPPRPVEYINCTSDSFQDMTCRWCNHPPGTLTTYTFMYRIGTIGDFASCPQRIDNCACYLPVLSPFLTYHVRILARTVTQALPPYEEAIVAELYRVILHSVRYLAVESVSRDSLDIRWSLPPYMEGYDELIQYKIRWSSEFDDGNYTEVNVTANTSYTARGLDAYTRYRVQVSARIRTSPYWSDVTESSERTKAAAACTGPALLEGVYRRSPCSKRGCFHLQLFYQAYNATCANGQVQRYVVTYTSDTGDVGGEDVGPESYSAMLQNLDETKRYTVCLQAFTGEAVRGGESFRSPSTCITVPRQAQWAEPPERYYAEVTDNGTALTFHFQKRNATMALLSCKPRQDDALQCENSPAVHYFSGTHSPYRLAQVTSGDVYALSAVENGVSSGLTSHVIYPCQPDKRPNQLKLTLEVTDDSLRAAWVRPPCDQDLQKAHITRYSLVLQETSTSKEKDRKVLDNGWLTHTTFRGLEPATEYSVSLQAASRAGYGPRTVERKTTADAGGTFNKVPLTVAVAAGFVVALLIIIAIIWFCGPRDCKMVKAMLLEPITPPPDTSAPVSAISNGELNSTKYFNQFEQDGDSGFGTRSTRGDGGDVISLDEVDIPTVQDAEVRSDSGSEGTSGADCPLIGGPGAPVAICPVVFRDSHPGATSSSAGSSDGSGCKVGGKKMYALAGKPRGSAEGGAGVGAGSDQSSSGTSHKRDSYSKAAGTSALTSATADGTVSSTTGSATSRAPSYAKTGAVSGLSSGVVSGWSSRPGSSMVQAYNSGLETCRFDSIPTSDSEGLEVPPDSSATDMTGSSSSYPTDRSAPITIDLNALTINLDPTVLQATEGDALGEPVSTHVQNGQGPESPPDSWASVGSSAIGSYARGHQVSTSRGPAPALPHPPVHGNAADAPQSDVISGMAPLTVQTELGSSGLIDVMDRTMLDAPCTALNLFPLGICQEDDARALTLIPRQDNAEEVDDYV